MQKHGVKTLNRDRDSLKEEQNLSASYYYYYYYYDYYYCCCCCCCCRVQFLSMLQKSTTTCFIPSRRHSTNRLQELRQADRFRRGFSSLRSSAGLEGEGQVGRAVGRVPRRQDDQVTRAACTLPYSHGLLKLIVKS